jgi:threonine dehydratase
MSVQFVDVLSARQAIAPYLPITPSHNYPILDEYIGAEIYIKHENYHAVGAFKIRGGINLVSRMSAEERQRGLVAASTGNHGQSIARAGQIFGARVRILVPEGANPNKVAAMQKMGAQVLHHGARFNDALDYARNIAEDDGSYFVDNGNEPLLIAGVATPSLELLEAVPNLDAIFVPVGSGTLAAGTCIVAKTLNPAIHVIGVQSEKAPAAYESWRSGSIQTRPNETMVEGVSTGRGFEIPQEIMRQYLDDFVLVSDEAVMRATAWLIEKAHTLAEGAGAAPLAAIYQEREKWRGKKLGMICSGGNISLHQLRQALDFSSEKQF